MGPIKGPTPDRSRIRPKSPDTRQYHPCSCGLGPGTPPRLGKGHPSSAARRSDPPLTELARSRRGAGVRVYLHPRLRKESVDVECPQLGSKGSFAAIYRNDRLTPITSSNHMMRSSCHPPSTVRRRQPFAHDPPRQSRICCNTQSRARSRSTRALTPGVGRLRTRNRALSEGPRCQGRGPTGPGLRCRSLTPRAGHGCQRCGSARALKRPRVDYPA